jgi:hypothetical protein
MIDEKFDVKGFDYNLVMKECESKKTIDEQLRYLRYLLMEWRLNPPRLDPNGEIVPSFEKRLEIQITYREETTSTKPSVVNGEKIIWARNKQDFAPLFDLMMQLGFITFRRNKWEMLCNHFTWNDGEMTPKQLKDSLSNINHNPETHQVSDEISQLMDVLRKMKSS